MSSLNLEKIEKALLDCRYLLNQAAAPPAMASTNVDCQTLEVLVLATSNMKEYLLHSMTPNEIRAAAGLAPLINEDSANMIEGYSHKIEECIGCDKKIAPGETYLWRKGQRICLPCGIKYMGVTYSEGCM